MDLAAEADLADALGGLALVLAFDRRPLSAPFTCDAISKTPRGPHSIRGLNLFWPPVSGRSYDEDSAD